MIQLEDLGQGAHLLPKDPKERAYSRLWTDHLNRKIIPLFYRYLQAQDTEKQLEYAAEYKAEIDKLVEAADKEGPFFLGKDLSFVDVQFAPWMVRHSRVLKPYRGWPDAEPGSRWAKWIEAIENDPSVKNTTSGDHLYLDSYERYAGECHLYMCNYVLMVWKKTGRIPVRLPKRSTKEKVFHERI
jgi:glutathione S-transferase